MLFLELPPLAFIFHFLIQSGLPGPTNINSQSRKCPTDMPTDKSAEGKFSVESPSYSVYLGLCQVVNEKKTSTGSIYEQNSEHCTQGVHTEFLLSAFSGGYFTRTPSWALSG